MELLNLPIWQNKRGTSDRTCGCGSWMQHWLNFSGQSWPLECSVYGCNNFAEVGAHIYSPGVSYKEYIVPMCKSCNGRDDSFSIKSGIERVPANVSETCGRNIQHFFRS